MTIPDRKMSVETLDARLTMGRSTPSLTLSIRELSVIGYAQGFTHWHLNAKAHTLADIEAIGYMDQASGMISSGDHVHVSSVDGAAIYLARIKDMRQVMLFPMARVVVEPERADEDDAHERAMQVRA